MKLLSKIRDFGAREAWLFWNRHLLTRPEDCEVRRLLIDVSTIIRYDAQTGIQRVVRAVWSELKRRSGDGFLLVPIYATTSHGYCYAPPDFLGCEAEALRPIPVRTGPGDKFLGLDLSAHLLPGYRKQLRAWKANGAAIAILVYDLLPLSRPDWFSTRAVDSFHKWFDVLENDADQALCISNEVAADLGRRLCARGARGPSITTIRMGADIAASLPSSGMSPAVAQFLEKVRFRHYVLMVGTIEPRKGYDFSLSVFERLWREWPSSAPDLVIAGKPGWKTKSLQDTLRSHPERGKRLHWLDDVSDEVLCRLYGACSCIFVASYGEGFGLPLIEAAMFGRPVLARDLAVFREQELPNVQFFEDDSVDRVGALLMQLATTRSRSRPSALELPTWSACVDDLLRQTGIKREESNGLGSALRKAS